MKTFKQFLVESPTEWNVSWQKHIMELVFSSYDSFMMVHPAMIRKVYGYHENITAFHACNLLELERLMRIQNGNKTISCFTEINTEGGDYDYFDLGRKLTGDRYYKEKNGENNDVLVKVYGYMMSGASEDMNSKPDNRGIRGFDFSEGSYLGLMHDFKTAKMKEYCTKYNIDPVAMIKIFMKKTYDEYRTPETRRTKEVDLDKMHQYSSYFIEMVKQDHPILLRQWYGEYYKLLLNWMRENKDLFASWKRTDFTAGDSYNEILVSHFRIEEILDITFLGLRDNEDHVEYEGDYVDGEKEVDEEDEPDYSVHSFDNKRGKVRIANINKVTHGKFHVSVAYCEEDIEYFVQNN
jgi:hypothetical protein